MQSTALIVELSSTYFLVAKSLFSVGVISVPTLTLPPKAPFPSMLKLPVPAGLSLSILVDASGIPATEHLFRKSSFVTLLKFLLALFSISPFTSFIALTKFSLFSVVSSVRLPTLLSTILCSFSTPLASFILILLKLLKSLYLLISHINNQIRKAIY